MTSFPGRKLPDICVRWRWRLLAFLVVLFFCTLIARNWHPIYRFTSFLQLAADNGHTALPALSEHPVFQYPGAGGYDGQYYAQIACDPSVRSAELPGAIDNVSYRARRILAPALAWLLGFGNPAWIIHAYSILNVLFWLLLALITWKLLAVGDARSALAWTGLLLSAGALHSVRFALTDLIALVFIAAAFYAIESKRPIRGAALLALGGLGRETALAALPGAWSGPWMSPRSLLRNALLSAAVLAPYILWLIYLNHRFPQINGDPGLLTVPGRGLVEKLSSSLVALQSPADGYLVWSTLLAVVALLVQAIYLLVRPRLTDRWWRAGLPYVGLMLVVNHEVWEGDPGAITRVILPLQLAFNILAVRHKAPLLILIAGNLSVFAGLAPFRTPVHDLRELGHGRPDQVAIVARTGTGWYATEKSWSQTRTWSQASSTVELQIWPATASPNTDILFDLRAFTPCTVSIHQQGTLLWRGPVTTKRQSVRLTNIQLAPGATTLVFSSDQPAQPESPAPGARTLGFALYDLSLEKPAP